MREEEEGGHFITPRCQTDEKDGDDDRAGPGKRHQQRYTTYTQTEDEEE